MGLDMYLNAKLSVQKVDWKATQARRENDAEATFQYVITPEYTELANFLKLTDIGDTVHGFEVSTVAAYWRKANAIHGWFVSNVQDGEDNCAEYWVTKDKLEELLKFAKEALANKDSTIFTPTAGFFFGSDEVDEWYWGSLKNTVTQLERIMAHPRYDELEFYYQSSW